MIGCYRKSDAHDPEIYTRAVVSVLMRYPFETVVAVTEPATGLPARVKWLPSIAVLVEACEVALPKITHQRRAIAVLEASEMDRSGRPSLAELRQKHGPNWGLKTV